MVQWRTCLLRQHEDLSSDPSTPINARLSATAVTQHWEMETGVSYFLASQSSHNDELQVRGETLP